MTSNQFDKACDAITLQAAILKLYLRDNNVEVCQDCIKKINEQVKTIALHLANDGTAKGVIDPRIAQIIPAVLTHLKNNN